MYEPKLIRTRIKPGPISGSRQSNRESAGADRRGNGPIRSGQRKKSCVTHPALTGVNDVDLTSSRSGPNKTKKMYEQNLKIEMLMQTHRPNNMLQASPRPSGLSGCGQSAKQPLMMACGESAAQSIIIMADYYERKAGLAICTQTRRTSEENKSEK